MIRTVFNRQSMPERPNYVSVITPLAPALDRVKQLLFSPFDLGRWLVLGFCVWLAELGRVSGGGGSGFHPSGNRGFSLQAMFEQAREYFLQNLVWIVPLISVVLLMALVIWLALTWISSRGQFMVLHDVSTGRAEVALPWKQFRAHGDSLFVFRAVLGLISFGLLLPLVAAIVWMLAQILTPEVAVKLPVAGMIMATVAITFLAVLLAVVRKLTRDFVVPIMYLQTPSCMEAWRRFWVLFKNNVGEFVLYLLFSIVVAVATGFIVFAAILVTCCCAGCLMMIPYVGTVLLLPISIFKRCYSLEYLGQYGPEWNVFSRT
jgi:hypothetical protein